MAGTNVSPSSSSSASNLASAAFSVARPHSVNTSPVNGILSEYVIGLDTHKLQGTRGGFIRVDVKVKHVSATRRIPLMSVHSKDGFQVVNYCETEKEEFLKQEVMELTELQKMNYEDCDDSKDDDFVMVSNVSGT